MQILPAFCYFNVAKYRKIAPIVHFLSTLFCIVVKNNYLCAKLIKNADFDILLAQFLHILLQTFNFYEYEKDFIYPGIDYPFSCCLCR